MAKIIESFTTLGNALQFTNHISTDWDDEVEKSFSLKFNNKTSTFDVTFKKDLTN